MTKDRLAALKAVSKVLPKFYKTSVLPHPIRINWFWVIRKLNILTKSENKFK